MNQRESLRSRFFTAVVLSAIGLAVLCAYAPTSITEDLGPRKLTGLFVVFLFWLAALAGWGKAATFLIGVPRERKLPRAEEWTLALSLGSLFAAAWAHATAAIGHHRGVTISSVVFLLGGTLALAVFGRGPGERGPKRDRRRLFLHALVSTYVVLRFVQATRLARHGDPLYYHLVAPVSWVRGGLVRFDSSHPLNFIASLWECLYLWPAQWFLGTGDVGLPAIQIFAQWSHLAIGWIGMGLAVVTLLRRFRFPPIPAILGGFAALATRSLWWTSALAKNDCGASLWLLSGIVLLWTVDRITIRRYIAAGMLIGAAFVAKYSVVFVILPLAVVWSVLRLRREAGRLPVILGGLLVGGLLSAGPLLVRNWLGTGNPFFPFPSRWANPESLSESSREYIEGIAPSGLDTGVSWRLERLLELSKEGPLAVVSLMAPALLLRRFFVRKPRPARRGGPLTLHALSFASLLCFLAAGKAGTDLRLLGPGLVLLNVSGTLITLMALRGLARTTARLRWLPAGCLTLTAIASTCRLAPEAVIDRVRDFPLQREIERHTGGDTKLWIVTHVPPSERIVTSGDNEIYYLLGYDVRVGSDDLWLDRLWRHAIANGAGAEDVLVEFRRQGFRYLLDTRFPWEASGLAARLKPALDRHPEWLVFQGREARLVDLRRVEKARESTRDDEFLPDARGVTAPDAARLLSGSP